jgi:hypothetical protein
MQRAMMSRRNVAIAVGGLVALLGALTAWVNFARLAVWSARAKSPAISRSANAVKADSVFWSTLHAGAYDRLPDAIEIVTRAYLETPRDAVTASHVGWLHIWRLAEASRLDSAAATITDNVVLARKYFQEAVALDPRDARKVGFLGAAMVSEGTIDGNEKLVRRGYYTLRRGIDMWPEFNLFTAGYVLSRAPADSRQFHEALKWQWDTFDICAGEKIDRKNPDFSKYMKLETRDGPKRVCWNSWIAPHNFEGFALNAGDMLVKSGDWETAQKVYTIARLSSTYSVWPYRAVLEDRVRRARDNVAVFNAPGTGGRSGLMIRSTFACMACHQESGQSSVAVAQTPSRRIP